MPVRAKFRCLEVTRRYSHTTDAGLPTETDHMHFRVRLAPVLPMPRWFPGSKRGDRCPENEVFYAATPAGECLMEVVSPAAAAFFQPGAAYYVDFTEADG